MKKSFVVVICFLGIGVALAALTENERRVDARILSRSEESITPIDLLGGSKTINFPLQFTPDETLHYDGTPATGIGLTNGGSFYTAARFTPTTACTLKAILFYQWNHSSNDYVFVFGEDTDTTPGVVLDSVPYTGTDTMRWKRIDLNPPLVIQAGTDFWACVRLTHTAGLYPIGCDAGPMVRNRGGFISTNGTRWQQIADLGLNYNFNIRAVISRIPGLTHDVGVSKIVAPGSNIGPGSYQPVARITNYGTSAETSIPVYCWIDSGATRIYNQTVNVAGPLQPGSRIEVTFPVWNTGPGGANYTVRMFTDLSGDLNRSNDTLQQQINIANVFAVMDHDTGYCKLSVSCFGSIGYDNPQADLGSGFCYPKSAASCLFYGSFAMGNDENYVADRHFSRPASGPVNNDLRPVDSLRAIVPPLLGDEHFYGTFSDAGHPSPKNLKVIQNSYMNTTSNYDDFVVIVYDIQNEGSNTVNGLYAGVFMDFDIGSSPATNQGASDTVLRLTYMRQASSANPTVGVKILEPPTFANLSLIDHAIYVYPDSAMTDGMKWRFLNGTIRQRNSNRPYDWSLVTSAGPFNLEAGATQRFAIAVVGGSDESAIRANANAAQDWYNTNVGVAEIPGVNLIDKVTIVPNPFRKRTTISYNVTARGQFVIEAYDASGRMVDRVDFFAPTNQGYYVWQPQNLSRGVYFLNIQTPDSSIRTKALIVE
ncbi:MAG: T9SS type A sorting domain-containing protein [bacterium]